MYRLFQPTENEKGACKDCSSFSMQTHPIQHNRVKPEIPYSVLQAYTAQDTSASAYMPQAFQVKSICVRNFYDQAAYIAQDTNV